MSKGNIDGILNGKEFSSCIELSQACIHQYQAQDKKSTMAPGIVTDKDSIASSILLSGGYSDDEDYGDKIIYTGSGGQGEDKKIQTIDQTLDGRAGRNNQGLVNAFIQESPIRVIRGWKHKSNFSPSSGYRYAGIFYIFRYWWSHSKDGPLIIRFELICEEKFNGASEHAQSP